MSNPTIIANINQKGGVGKTTSSINISAFLAKQGHKVLLIDLDPQANATMTCLGNKDDEKESSPPVNPDSIIGTHALLIDQIKKKEFSFSHYIIKAHFETFENTLDVMPSNIRLSEAEITLSQQPCREEIMTKAFQRFSNDMYNYDYVMIDCPPSLGVLTINAFVASQFLLTPVDASAYSLEGLVALVNSLQDVNTVFHLNRQFLGFFFAKFSKHEQVYQESYKLVSQVGQENFIEQFIRKDTKIEQAPYQNKSIVDYAPDCSAYQDYEALTNEIQKRIKKLTKENIKREVTTSPKY